MDFLLIIFGLLLLGIVLPVLTLFILRGRLLRKNHHRLATVTTGIAMAFLLFCGCVTYTFIYPPDSVFEDYFVKITGTPFPASGEIVESAESGLDPHGDYTSCAMVEVNAEEYSQLLRVIQADTSFTATDFTKDSTFVASKEYFKVTKSVHPVAYYKTFYKGSVNVNVYQFIGFLKRGRAVIIYRCST